MDPRPTHLCQLAIPIGSHLQTHTRHASGGTHLSLFRQERQYAQSVSSQAKQPRRLSNFTRRIDYLPLIYYPRLEVRNLSRSSAALEVGNSARFVVSLAVNEAPKLEVHRCHGRKCKQGAESHIRISV